MATYITKPSQNIFDVSIELYGTIEGLFDLLISNPSINMNSDLSPGTELQYHESYLLNKSVVDSLKNDHIIPANGERHVYYKEFDSHAFAFFSVSSTIPSVSFVFGGEGDVFIDWGDNTQMEHVLLTHENSHVSHTFDSKSSERIIKLYGDTEFTKFTHMDVTNAGGEMIITRPITIDEYVSSANSFKLDHLFLIKNTYSVDLRNCLIKSLAPIVHLELQTLDLRGVRYQNGQVLEDYFTMLINNYGTRRAGTIYLDGELSQNCMALINTIKNEAAWNTPVPWKFIINGKIY